MTCTITIPHVCLKTFVQMIYPVVKESSNFSKLYLVCNTSFFIMKTEQKWRLFDFFISLWCKIFFIIGSTDDIVCPIVRIYGKEWKDCPIIQIYWKEWKDEIYFESMNKQNKESFLCMGYPTFPNLNSSKINASIINW